MCARRGRNREQRHDEMPEMPDNRPVCQCASFA
jgi:hypothetical protein